MSWSGCRRYAAGAGPLPALRRRDVSGARLPSADADLAAVEQRLNSRPREVLGWRTPAEVFTAALAE